MIFQDYFRIRRIAPGADGIVTGASDEIISTIGGYYDWNTTDHQLQRRHLFHAVALRPVHGRFRRRPGPHHRGRRQQLPGPALRPAAAAGESESEWCGPCDLGQQHPGPSEYRRQPSLLRHRDEQRSGCGVGSDADLRDPAERGVRERAQPERCAVHHTGGGQSGHGHLRLRHAAKRRNQYGSDPDQAKVAGSLSSTFTVSGAELDTNTADNTTTATVTVDLAAAIIEVHEVVTVTDAVSVLPSAMISLLETVMVTRHAGLLPSAMIGVTETVVVTDGPNVTGISNTAPAANAGLDQIIEATSALGAIVALSGVATDADGDPLTLTWTGPCGTAASASAAFTCSLGSHALTLTVSDNRGSVVSDTVNVTVRDTTRPELTTPTTVFASATSNAGATVSYIVSATDIVSGPITPSCSHASGATFAIGGTTVTCTATDAAGNVSTRLFLISVASDLALRLPGNLRVPATSASGAVVTYSAFARAIYGGDTTDYLAICSPESGSTFPMGTTTVSCYGFQFGGTPPSGSFTVTVDVGTPTLTASVANKGRDAAGTVWIDLRLSNTGSGHARNVSLSSLTLRTLSGTGSVTYDASRSGPLPLQVGSLDVGQARTVRLYVNVPATVARFSITEGITFQNVIGTTPHILRRTGGDSMRYVAALVLTLAFAPAASAGPITFELLPATGAISGDAGSTIGWGYQSRTAASTGWS